MARYIGPKNRLARSLSTDLGLKTDPTKAAKRLLVPPGQHGQKRRRGNLSDYGQQLKEKQKVRWIYGILEKQCKLYYNKASKNPKSTGLRLLQLLEFRLDNVIYRLGFAPTRAAARQYVNHGHVLVNGKKLDIPSYQVKIKDVVSISAKIGETPIVKDLLAIKSKDLKILPWLERKANSGVIIREPQREEIDSGITEQLVVEYYSR